MARLLIGDAHRTQQPGLNAAVSLELSAATVSQEDQPQLRPEVKEDRGFNRASAHAPATLPASPTRYLPSGFRLMARTNCSASHSSALRRVERRVRAAAEDVQTHARIELRDSIRHQLRGIRRSHSNDAFDVRRICGVERN